MLVTQCFWFVPTGDLWRVDYQRLEDEPASAIPNGTPEVTAMDGKHCLYTGLYSCLHCQMHPVAIRSPLRCFGIWHTTCFAKTGNCKQGHSTSDSKHSCCCLSLSGVLNNNSLNRNVCQPWVGACEASLSLPGRLVVSDLIGVGNRQLANVRRDHVVAIFLGFLHGLILSLDHRTCLQSTTLQSISIAERHNRVLLK